jgi:hypothetical protein
MDEKKEDTISELKEDSNKESEFDRKLAEIISKSPAPLKETLKVSAMMDFNVFLIFDRLATIILSDKINKESVYGGAESVQPPTTALSDLGLTHYNM